MPMKNASSDMNSAERPMKQTTRLRALAIGLRLITTAAPKPNMTSAKIQNKKAGITRLRIGFSLLFVPLQDHAVHHAADFEELFFVMHHVSTGEAGNGVIFSQIDRLFRANLLT